MKRLMPYLLVLILVSAPLQSLAINQREFGNFADLKVYQSGGVNNGKIVNPLSIMSPDKIKVTIAVKNVTQSSVRGVFETTKYLPRQNVYLKVDDSIIPAGYEYTNANVIMGENSKMIKGKFIPINLSNPLDITPQTDVGEVYVQIFVKVNLDLAQRVGATGDMTPEILAWEQNARLKTQKDTDKVKVAIGDKATEVSKVISKLVKETGTTKEIPKDEIKSAIREKTIVDNSDRIKYLLANQQKYGTDILKEVSIETAEYFAGLGALPKAISSINNVMESLTNSSRGTSPVVNLGNTELDEIINSNSRILKSENAPIVFNTSSSCKSGEVCIDYKSRYDEFMSNNGRIDNNESVITKANADKFISQVGVAELSRRLFSAISMERAEFYKEGTAPVEKNYYFDIPDTSPFKVFEYKSTADRDGDGTYELQYQYKPFIYSFNQMRTQIAFSSKTLEYDDMFERSIGHI